MNKVQIPISLEELDKLKKISKNTSLINIDYIKDIVNKNNKILNGYILAIYAYITKTKYRFKIKNDNDNNIKYVLEIDKDFIDSLNKKLINI